MQPKITELNYPPKVEQPTSEHHKIINKEVELSNARGTFNPKLQMQASKKKGSS